MKRILADLLAVVAAGLLRPFHVASLPYGGNWNGLGNRLKGMSNFYARGYRRFLLIWSDDNWVSDKFSALFSMDGCNVIELDTGHVFYKLCKMVFRRFVPNGVVMQNYPYWSFILPEDMRDDSMKKQWSFCDRISHSVDWWFDRTPATVRDYYRGFFASLKPSPAVCERVNSFDRENIKDLVCVQIRNNRNPEDEKDVCAVSTIFAKMEQYPSDTKFFISYMDKTFWDLAVERFGGRVFCLENKDVTSMVDAVADMWLLGRGKALIASPESTFSEVAWWWGGCKCPVVMLSPEFNQRSLKKPV